MTPRTRRQLRLYLGVIAVSPLVGAGYGVLNGLEAHTALLSGVIGAMHGFAIGAPLGAMEIFGPGTRLGLMVQRAPFLVTVLTKGLVYGIVIAIVEVGRIAERLIGLRAAGAGGFAIRPFVFSVAVMVAFIFVIQVSLLVGGRNLRALVMGRYHSPRMEERFFLFVDVRGSTGIAERLGPVAVHRFLNRVFGLAADPVDEHKGEIHQYVGDEMVVTWPLAAGRIEARPIACFFAIARALAGASPRFTREFGVAPRVRAALHAGTVIAGEVGESKRDIVFHGDVMNTASRLEHMAGELDRDLLVSAGALSCLDGIARYVVDDVGICTLRGRTGGIQVYAVEPVKGADR